MSGYKKYPHVPCDSVVLKLDEVILCLENYVVEIQGRVDREEMSRMATRAIEGLREVIARRGATLSVQRRRRGMSGTYMTIR